jgi:Xaa-Pro aminopeptidase
MKEGAKLVEAGMKTAYENIKPGVKQSYVAGKIQDSLIGGNEEIKIGGEYAGLTTILASGISASASHLTPKDNLFNNNEGTIIELAGVKNRYHCPLSRTVYCGKPDSKTSDTMKITNEGVEKAISVTKPGNTANDVAVGLLVSIRKIRYRKRLASWLCYRSWLSS